MSISEILNISKKAIFNYRSAINVTAKNIANVNTEGYKRRRVDLSSVTSQLQGFNQMNGELIQENIVRIRNSFVENQLYYETQNLAKYKLDESLFNQIEDIFAEPSDAGLSKVLQDFWDSWNTLATDPESVTARNIVKDKGIVLSNTFKRYYTSLVQLQRSSAEDIGKKVEKVNSILSQLASLNTRLVANKSRDLMDERDRLLSELSELINMKAREEANGAVTVLVGNQIVLSGGNYSELQVDLSMENNLYNVEIYVGGGSQLTNVDSGEIGSLMHMVNDEIPEIVRELDNMAVTLSIYVNTLHVKGYSLEGKTGIRFFKSNITGASNFELNDEIVNDPTLIVASSRPDEPGNNEIAMAIHDLQYRDIISGSTVSDYYNALISRIGMKSQEVEFLRSSQEKVVTGLQNTLDSISGVSLDEEMTNLMEYQHAYEAAAKMVKTVDELIQTVLSLV
ncbi:MAG: flagellar hook-associated protein FlgK [Candidatus Marinimicrobia bacterium]|nr:flagellar hook-associated protein FlgK [Candidatus Neomarinimicrobiota bacterium]